MKPAIGSLLPTPEIVIGKSVTTQIVTVGTTATLLIDNNRGPSAYVIVITNPATPLYIGGPGVTKEAGFPIDSSQLVKFAMLENTKLYAIAYTDVEVRILDMGL